MQYAWHVSQYGDINVIDAVYDVSSYGRESPFTYNSGSIAWYVRSDGDLGNGGVYGSHGK